MKRSILLNFTLLFQDRKRTGAKDGAIKTEKMGIAVFTSRDKGTMERSQYLPLHLLTEKQDLKRMEKDNNEHAPAVSLSSPLVEHESIRKADGSSKKTDGSSSTAVSGAGPANAGNLPREHQDQTEAHGIDNMHTYVQGKSTHILGEAISKLVSDLKNKRFENKKTPRK